MLDHARQIPRSRTGAEQPDDARGPIPRFLIIGAMKAGTTTLYRDLLEHPGIHMPLQKEPETLVRHPTPEAAAADYADLFRGAPAGAMLGEASTAYAKLPDHPGVPELARAVCGPDLKAIYIARDPIERIVSQYKHERDLGLTDLPFEKAVRTLPRYADWSRTEMQLAPWRAALGEENLLVLDFAEYMADRTGTVRRVLAFLGAEAPEQVVIDPSTGWNRAGVRRTPSGMMRLAIRSAFYQRRIKPLLSERTRHRIAGLILPRSRNPQLTVDPETRAFLLAALAEAPPDAETAAEAARP